MNVVNIADLKNNLSRHLARVRKGGEITVMDRNTPVARIIPFAPARPAREQAGNREPDATAQRIADLARQGVVSPGEPQTVAEWVETHAPLPLPPGSPSALDVLLDMRRESTR